MTFPSSGELPITPPNDAMQAAIPTPPPKSITRETSRTPDWLMRSLVPVITSLLAVVSLPSCALLPWQGKGGLAAFHANSGSLRTSGLPQGVKSVTIPLKPTITGLAVMVHINCKPAKLLLDTGAAMTCITPELARELGLVAAGPGQRVYSASGGKIIARRALTKRITIGGAWTENEPVLVTPIFPGIDGLLGIGTLADWDFRIDPAAKTLTLFPVGKAPHLDRETAVPLTFDLATPGTTRNNPQGLRAMNLKVPVRVEGHDLMAEPDTGFGGVLKLPAPLIRKYSPSTLAAAGPRHITGLSLSGNSEGQTARLQEFVFGPDTLRQLPIGIEDSASDSKHDRQGLLGYSVLRHYVMTFSIARGQLRVKPLGTVRQATRRTTTGMAFDPNYKVLGVTPDGPAAKAGILAGDQLLTVNGKPVKRISAEDSYVLKLRPPGSALKVRYRRGTSAPAEVTVVVARE